MIREALATVAGVAVIGGAANVVNNGDGSSTVTVDEGNKKTSVRIEGDGRSYSCPESIVQRLDALTEDLGRLKITEGRISRRIKTLDRRYPDHTAPDHVVVTYNTALDRHKGLVSAYNKTVRKYNRTLKEHCE